MGDAAVSRAKVEDDRVFRDRMGPVEAGQQAVVRCLGGLVDGVGWFPKNPVMDVESTSTHHVLVKNPRVFFVVCSKELR
jgi:hypothetical protein